MSTNLEKKLKKLPATPGVYFFKDKAGDIIYVGKAARLRNRVRSYFQKGRPFDAKTSLLVAEIAGLDFQPTDTEDDALFLEAELIRRYRPRFNILLRDDKSSLNVRINLSSDYPTVTLVRRPLPDGARYFGPFNDSWALKQALRYLRRAFPYATGSSAGRRVKLQYHLGLDPGLEEGRTNLRDYRANLRKLIRVLTGRKAGLIKQLEREMKAHARASEFEQAARVRDQLRALSALGRSNLLSSRELAEDNRDHALNQLADLLGFKNPPQRIEGFDISHIQGSDNSASMVVFTFGLPDKAAYRKFRMRKAGNDDFAHMSETISRRLSETNVKKWGLPDLFLIDGGKGQLSSALQARDQAGQPDLPMIGLAKNEEKVVIDANRSLPAADTNKIIVSAREAKSYIDQSGGFISILLPPNSPGIKLLQRIRDESHRFALSYHTGMRLKRQTTSQLDLLPGVGPVTRKKLIKSFGSLKSAAQSPRSDFVKLLGPKRGERIYEQLQSLKP